MTWYFVIVVIIAVIFLIGHLGLPETYRPAPNPPFADEVMEGAEPWRFDGESDVAFLVSHGFGGSAFNTRPLGEYLNSMGHTAIGVLLPGHGTTLESLNESRFYHWREYLERKFLEERNNFRHIFLVGFSMGGTVMLDIAARHADSFRPAGIITISTPVFFNGFYNGKIVFPMPTTTLTGFVKIFAPIVKDGRNRPESLDHTNPWVGYSGGTALEALHSFKRSFRPVRRGLRKISAPYCSIMAANDRTVPADNQFYIYNHIGSPEKRAYMLIMPPDLSTMHPLLTHKTVNKRVFRFIGVFVQDILEKDKLKEKRIRRFTTRERFNRWLEKAFKRKEAENLTG